MKEGMSVAKQAATDIEVFLNGFKETIAVINVEDVERYQEKDIDLLWRRYSNGKEIETTIEIKGDRHHYTGNYFFETISNKSKQTLGCFMYTEAEYLFYYYVKEKELHVIPMETTRKWFKENMEDFKEVETSTPIGNDYYITVGRLVNRALVKKHIKNMKIVKL